MITRFCRAHFTSTTTTTTTTSSSVPVAASHARTRLTPSFRRHRVKCYRRLMSSTVEKSDREFGPRAFKYAAIQLLVSGKKDADLENARERIREAANNGAKLIALPECFNCPYSNNAFPDFAEPVPGGPSTDMLSAAAKEHGVFLVGGSVPERDGEKIYNTSTVWGPDGNLLAKHRKVHLFDIDVPGKITFRESDTLSPGDSITVLKETEEGLGLALGVAICYDIRFAELAQRYAKEGAKFLIYPGAFNMTTGPAHWTLLARARATDNQLYVSVVSPARNPNSSYQAYGHTSVVDPWARVIAEATHEPTILYATIDPDYPDEIRSQIPIRHQRRPDVY